MIKHKVLRRQYAIVQTTSNTMKSKKIGKEVPGKKIWPIYADPIFFIFQGNADTVMIQKRKVSCA